MARIKGKNVEAENHVPVVHAPTFLDCPLHAGVHSERKFLAYPFFDLTKAPRRQEMQYLEVLPDGDRVDIRVNAPTGIATIYDRDLLLYIGSLTRQRILANPDILNDPRNVDHRTFLFTANDFCEATSRSNGDGYDRIEQIVERLRTTNIRTTVRAGGERTRGWFNWLGEGTYVKTREDDESDGFVCAVLCEWLFKAIIRNGDMLAIPEAYFHLGPIERRLYDLAYVECCGNEWHTTVGALQARAGSDMLVRQFKAYLVRVGKSLPEYEVLLMDEFEKPAETGAQKRGGRPSVANQRVIVRPRTTAFELTDLLLSKGKPVPTKKPRTKPKRAARKRSAAPLEVLGAQSTEVPS
jgi:hypothetical protein